MTEVLASEVAFCRSGDVNIAYRVVGDGPVDLVYVQGAYTHLDVEWELPAYRRSCERLGSFSCLILFDKRGMGMSERVPGSVRDLVAGSGLSLEDRGIHALKRVDEPKRPYALAS